MCDTLIYGYVKFGDSRVDLRNVIYIYVLARNTLFRIVLHFTLRGVLGRLTLIGQLVSLL